MSIPQVIFHPLPGQATDEQIASATAEAFEAAGGPACIAEQDFVAVKLHVGENSTTTIVPPLVFKRLGELIRARGGQPFLAETSTLYRGERENAIKHALHAHRQGFGIEATGMPFLSLDGLAGNTEVEVEIPGILNRKVKIAREILMADALVAVAHMTGHMVTGFGGILKTLGMGLASRMGKMRQHSSIHPEIKAEKCTFCQKCIRWCPEDAISERSGKAWIDAARCIGCGECVAVCRFEAVRYDWRQGTESVGRQMAEHALGALEGKREKCVFLNVAARMTKDCDCMEESEHGIIPDVGVFASADPVAVDQACQDVIRERHGKDLSALAYPALAGDVQLEHAEKIGLGSRTYQLKTL